MFRVAVTGHRWDRLALAHGDLVRSEIGRVLREVARVADETQRRFADAFLPAPPRLVLLSALAEGTDRLAASVALELGGWELHAVLPFDVSAYEADFRSPDSPPESLPEFRSLLSRASHCTTLDGVPGSFDAYVPLGRVLVDQSDLLIAVWDGQRGRGPGGTANVVARARRDVVPLVRLDTADPGSAWLESSDLPDDGRGAGLDGLAARIEPLLAPPTPPQGWQEWFSERVPRRRRSVAYDRVVAFFHDPARPAHPGGLWARVARALRVRTEPPADPARMTEIAWQQQWHAMPPELRHQVIRNFSALHGWADQLARWYASAFRQSFTWVFLLAWIATLSALLIAIGLDVPLLIGGSLVGVVEVTVLGVVYVVVRRARRHRYHERWLDYRSLAERVRHLSILWPLARTTSLMRLPPLAVPGDPKHSWIAWLLRATAREAGLLPGALDEAHALACRQVLADAELRPQQAFHRAALHRAEDVKGPLERLGERLFLWAAAIALLHVVLGLIGHHWMSLLRLLPAVEVGLAILGVSLPTIGASVHGFLGTGDFEGMATRAADLAPRLQELEGRLDRLLPVTLTGVGDVAVDAAEIMERELSTWRTLAATRRLAAI